MDWYLVDEALFIIKQCHIYVGIKNPLVKMDCKFIKEYVPEINYNTFYDMSHMQFTYKKKK